MKTSWFFLLAAALVLLSVNGAHANHYKGGYITYTVDAQNYLKRYFELHAYSDMKSFVQDPTVLITFGYGNSINAERHTYKELADGVAYSLYKWEHTFPGPGSFTVSWLATNRNPYILNMASPSDLYNMLVSTTIHVNPLRPNFTSISLGAPSFATAYVNQPFRFNLMASDADRDSLVYSLVTPQYMDSRGVRTEVPGYTVPEGLTINKFGEINWNNPPARGEYVLNVMVQEYKGKSKVVETVVELQLLVFEEDKEPEVILVNKERLTILKDGNVLATPNAPLKLTFFAHDKKGNATEDPVYESEFQLDHIRSSLTETVTRRDSLNGRILEVVIMPSTSLVRSQPYVVAAKAVLPPTTPAVSKPHSWAYVYVQVSSQSPLAAQKLKEPESAKVYPNPVTDRITIQAHHITTTLVMYNLAGKVVYKANLAPGENMIQRPANLSPGLYIYTVSDKYGKIGQGKLVLQ